MRIAAITMVRDEAVFLPLWLAHYGAQFGRENLFVIDHGSTDESTNVPGISVVRLPSTDLDEWQRVKFISGLHASLLSYYDVVIYTDVDEYLVADPQRHKDLRDFLCAHSDQAIAARGVNVLHDVKRERDIDLTHPPLEQRLWVRFDPLYCKPLIGRKQMSWGIGFHRVDGPVKLAADLILFHLRIFDLSIFTERQLSRQCIKMTDMSMTHNHNDHFRLSVEECRSLWFSQGEAEFIIDNSDDFTFDRACRYMTSGGGVSIHDTWPTARIPDRYRKSIPGIIDQTR